MGQWKGEAQLLLADLVLEPLEAVPGGQAITHQTIFAEGAWRGVAVGDPGHGLLDLEMHQDQSRWTPSF